MLNVASSSFRFIVGASSRHISDRNGLARYPSKIRRRVDLSEEIEYFKMLVATARAPPCETVFTLLRPFLSSNLDSPCSVRRQ